MKKLSTLCAAAALMLLAPTTAPAATLTVVNVAAPAVNCVFNASCVITVNDSTGTFRFTALGNGAFLQSRTFPPGLAGTPGAGKTAYLYRVDLRQGTTWTDCQVGLVINFGPVTKLTYPPNQLAHVFVITQGGLGSVGIKSAEQNGDVITFTFSTYLCAGQTSFFFGLAAATPPLATNATLFGIGSSGFVQIGARVPQH